MFKRFKELIDSLWAKHGAFRVAFVGTFLFSIIAIPVYIFSLFQPFFQRFFSLLALLFVSVLVASGKYQKGFRRKYRWVPLSITVLISAFISFNNYITNQINDSVFSAILCLIAVGCLTYYSIKKKG